MVDIVLRKVSQAQEVIHFVFSFTCENLKVDLHQEENRSVTLTAWRGHRTERDGKRLVEGSSLIVGITSNAPWHHRMAKADNVKIVQRF